MQKTLKSDIQFINNIKKLRLAKGIDRSLKLAQAIGVSGCYMSNLELNRNQPNLFVISKLLKYFECGFDDLFTFETKDTIETVDERQTVIE